MCTIELGRGGGCILGLAGTQPVSKGRAPLTSRTRGSLFFKGTMLVMIVEGRKKLMIVNLKDQSKVEYLARRKTSNQSQSITSTETTNMFFSILLISQQCWTKPPFAPIYRLKPPLYPPRIFAANHDLAAAVFRSFSTGSPSDVSTPATAVVVTLGWYC